MLNSIKKYDTILKNDILNIVSFITSSISITLLIVYYSYIKIVYLHIICVILIILLHVVVLFINNIKSERLNTLSKLSKYGIKTQATITNVDLYPTDAKIKGKFSYQYSDGKSTYTKESYILTKNEINNIKKQFYIQILYLKESPDISIVNRNLKGELSSVSLFSMISCFFIVISIAITVATITYK